MTENFRTKRTSSSQFEIMVDYMEKYGDLSRPSEDSSARITTLHRWIELKDILNAEESGDTKSVVKWRKVWSDLKNNTKRKIAKCQTAWGSTGPSSKAILSDLEVRVLQIVNSQGPGISEVVIEETTSEVITGQSIPIILDINQAQKLQNFENKKRHFEFVKNQSTSGEENCNSTDFRIKQCKTVENEEELHRLRIQKEKLLIIKEEIAVRREEEILKFEKEKNKLEILKLKLEIELLLDNNKLG